MITDIRLQHFRSYTDESFEFSTGVNIIVGPNASGKTNLLEAIMVSCLGKSYRVKDADLIQYDEPWARLDTHNAAGQRTVKLVRSERMLQKEFIIQDTSYSRLSIQKSVPLVLFEPNHLQLLSGSPELKREYIDGLLEQTIPGFGLTRKQYKRALTQRNTLLKHGGAAKDQLFAWNIRLSQLGGQIAAERSRLVSQLNEPITGLYRSLSNTKADVSLQYTSNCNTQQYSSDFLHKLESNLERDLLRGYTTVGPHRDSLEIGLNGHPIEEVASRGESRTLLLALKVLELELLAEKRQQKPILLLDDVFSELDGARRKALTEALHDHQTFITTTDADVVMKHFEHSHIIPVQREQN